MKVFKEFFEWMCIIVACLATVPVLLFSFAIMAGFILTVGVFMLFTSIFLKIKVNIKTDNKDDR